MAQVHVLIRHPAAERRWAAARGLAMLAVGVLLAWLCFDPARALTTLWYGVIPLLPAVFFLNPVLWRGVCPLATFNTWGNALGRPRPLSPRLAGVLGTGGLVLFHIMVPARHFAFNEHGPVLVATILAVAVLALLLGALFEVRSAFCNALCPVLPVEMLYGQVPLLRLDRGRCTACSVCTPRGCLDLAGGRTAAQVLGPSRRGTGWLLTPFGVFAAALPGFIIGYSLVPDGGIDRIGAVYGATIGGSLLSYLAVAAAVVALRSRAAVALPVIAAISGGLYYAFAGPAISGALAVPAWTGRLVQLAGIGLVTMWLVAALRPGGPTPSGSRSGSPAA